MGNRIKELRLAADLTQDQLAELVGTSGQQVSRLENSDRRLTTGWIDRIARALRVAPSALLERPESGELIHDPSELLLLGTWRELPKEGRQRVLDFVQFEASQMGKRNNAA